MCRLPLCGEYVMPASPSACRWIATHGSLCAPQTRIQNYQNEAPEKLNEDQKRLLKTLPTLEAVSKELEEVKKAIEVRGLGLAVTILGCRPDTACRCMRQKRLKSSRS